MEIGLESFVENTPDPTTAKAIPPAERINNLIDEVVLADKLGIDMFGIGEHHRAEYLASAPAIILAAAAARTERIRLASAVTVLSSDDPVRVFQHFATIDLISRGRAEIIVGRGSFIESYSLFGYDLNNYDQLFAEKLELLLKIRNETFVHWSGKHRAALTGQGVYPRPVQGTLPIWLGVGGTPNSFVRAGTLGLPLAVAIIGGDPTRFRTLIDLYREAGRRAGHAPERLRVAIHLHGFIADTNAKAADIFYPSYAATLNRIGRERGWGPHTREQFTANLGPAGALFVGDSETVAKKILRVNQALGGVSRFSLQFTVGSLPQSKVLHAIRLLGEEVAPAVKSGEAVLETASHHVKQGSY